MHQRLFWLVLYDEGKEGVLRREWIPLKVPWWARRTSWLCKECSKGGRESYCRLCVEPGRISPIETLQNTISGAIVGGSEEMSIGTGTHTNLAIGPSRRPRMNFSLNGTVARIRLLHNQGDRLDLIAQVKRWSCIVGAPGSQRDRYRIHEIATRVSRRDRIGSGTSLLVSAMCQYIDPKGRSTYLYTVGSHMRS